MTTADLHATRPKRALPFNHLRSDIPAGFVVFLVALPLCLGIAMASGVPLIAGLVSGILGGLVVAWLSGSQLSVSGPAAGLVVIVIDGITTLGSFSAFLVAIVLAGVMQWVLGRLRAGNLSACIPSTVIKGMLAAIGLILIMKQLPVAFGFSSAAEAMRLVPAEAKTFKGFTHAFDAVTGSALIVVAVALAILFLWESPRVRRIPVLGKLPAPLLVVLWGVAYQAFATYIHTGALADRQMVVLPEIHGPAGLLAQLVSPDWSALYNPQVYLIAASLAVVASLETLLSLEATDQIDPLKRVAPPNRELQAQGIANIMAGLLGGLPITAVIVRSSANVQAGAKSKLSAVVHGVLLLLSVMFLGTMLHWIPLAALSAILLHTGFKLAKPALFMAAWRKGAAGFVPFVVTVGAILATDLLEGILIGLACGILFVVRANTQGALSMTSNDGAHLLRLSKDVSFFSKAKMRSYLERVESGDSLVVDGSRCQFLDQDIRETLDDFVSAAPEREITVQLRSMPSTSAVPSEPGDGQRTGLAPA